MDGKLCSSGEGGTDGKDLPVGICMCGSAHDCGCVVDSSQGLIQGGRRGVNAPPGFHLPPPSI